MFSSDLPSDESKSTLSDSWQWITEIFDEANLPQFGLPVRWEQTAEKRKRVVFNPASMMCVDIETNQSKKLKSSPIGFIGSTRGKHRMPGTDTPAAARLTRYLEPRFNEHLVSDAKGEVLSPCLACGDYVSVESLALDHAQAKDKIQKRQSDFIERLNQDPEFARVVMSLEGIAKFFVNVEGQYYGTLFFYDLYFNDIDNLWLICSACNLHKSDQEVLSWFQEQWLYGDEFLDYVGKLKTDSPILLKTQNRQGLAEAAIEWYWDRHANYASIAKRLMADVVTPIQFLSQRVDRIVGLTRSGVTSEKRVERNMASLDFRIALLTAIATTKGIDMPRTASESPNSSDSENYLRVTDKEGNIIPITLAVYQKSVTKFVDSFEESLQAGIAATAVEELNDHPGCGDDENDERDVKKPRLGGTP